MGWVSILEMGPGSPVLDADLSRGSDPLGACSGAPPAAGVTGVAVGVCGIVFVLFFMAACNTCCICSRVNTSLNLQAVAVAHLFRRQQ